MGFAHMTEKKVIAFYTKAEAQILADLAWIATVKYEMNRGRTAKKTDGTLLYGLDGLTDAEIGALKICGRLKGILQTENGSTIAYGKPIQAYDQDPEQYYIFAPLELEAAGYIDLSEYEVIDLPDNWQQTPEI